MTAGTFPAARDADWLATPEVAPDFSLVDTGGRVVKLSGYRGRSHVVLVFNRGFT